DGGVAAVVPPGLGGAVWARSPAEADAAAAPVVGRTRVRVVARCRVVRVGAAGRGIAGLVGARVCVVAVARWAAHAGSAATRIGGRAGVAVVAGGGAVRVRTARGDVAGVGRVDVAVAACGGW